MQIHVLGYLCSKFTYQFNSIVQDRSGSVTVTLNFKFCGSIVFLEFVLNFLAKESKGKIMTSSLALFDVPSFFWCIIFSQSSRAFDPEGN